jgi:hypothetical protein
VERLCWKRRDRLGQHLLCCCRLSNRGWEGWKDVSVGRTSWEGWQAENRTPSIIDPERAPAEIHLHQFRVFDWRLSGGALGVTVVRRPIFRLPPFPACSIHRGVLATLPTLFIY